MKTTTVFLGLALAALLTGCATSATVVSSNTKPIILSEPKKVKLNFANTTDLPAGVYLPDFQAKKGTYYRAPGKIVTGGAGMRFLAKGGLFIPFPSEQDQRLGVWWDQQEQSGGLLTFGLTSPTIVHRFDEPIDCRTKND